jgi:hypothetical protein
MTGATGQRAPGSEGLTPARESELINLDVARAECGYNLRGLLSDGRCPECGEAVLSSLGVFLYGGRIDRPLSQSDIQWLKTVERAIGSLIAAALVPIVLGVWEWTGGLEFNNRVALAEEISVRVLTAFSLVLLSRREPGVSPARDSPWQRQILRWTAVIHVFSLSVVASLNLSGPPILWAVSIVGLLLCPLISIPLLYRYLSRLAARLPHPSRLPREATALVLVLLIISVLFALLGASGGVPFIAFGANPTVCIMAASRFARGGDGGITDLIVLFMAGGVLWAASWLLRFGWALRGVLRQVKKDQLSV